MLDLHVHRLFTTSGSITSDQKAPLARSRRQRHMANWSAISAASTKIPMQIVRTCHDPMAFGSHCEYSLTRACFCWRFKDRSLLAQSHWKRWEPSWTRHWTRSRRSCGSQPCSQPPCTCGTKQGRRRRREPDLVRVGHHLFEMSSQLTPLCWVPQNRAV